MAASSSAKIFEYFVVCGIGPEIATLEGNKGFQGMEVMYMPSLLDQYPPPNQSLYPPPPPQLPTCVLPAGVEFYASGFNSNDVATYPRSYPIVLTEGDGSKIYVACIAFRDLVWDDIIEAYKIPANSFADKCIRLVSRSPSFQGFLSAYTTHWYKKDDSFVLSTSASRSHSQHEGGKSRGAYCPTKG